MSDKKTIEELICIIEVNVYDIECKFNKFATTDNASIDDNISSIKECIAELESRLI